ncbi:hypothetical protein GOODEAATRI_028738 [Goodea atripinnis]|uniref:Uncharacterized protein n=1 Tax=Goodea atripinnis TaxID=208336 RepID=A0ABV0MLK6_9TELE
MFKAAFNANQKQRAWPFTIRASFVVGPSLLGRRCSESRKGYRKCECPETLCCPHAPPPPPVCREERVQSSWTSCNSLYHFLVLAGVALLSVVGLIIVRHETHHKGVIRNFTNVFVL